MNALLYLIFKILRILCEITLIPIIEKVFDAEHFFNKKYIQSKAVDKSKKR